ncbi:MAG TPA: BBP7 family outer membrane beta-barrel protein [Pirellulaceae bacterium]
MCRRTGPLLPGYLRAATLGWINPNGCGGCRPDGNVPGTSPYPYPWNGEYFQPCEGGSGYENYGDTCGGPYWYDIFAEAVVFTRTGTASQVLSSDGIRGFGPPNVVLSSDSADFGYEPGFRITGRHQCNAVYNIEASYLGALDWQNSASVTSDINSLYSVFSDFGNTPFGGFEDTDQAQQHSVSVEGELESAEVTFRRSWISPNYCVNGSWLLGARWINMEDALRFQSLVVAHDDPITPVVNAAERGPAFADYRVSVSNDLVGAQLGTSLVGRIIPGIAIGGEVKAGVYANAGDQTTQLLASGLPNDFTESVDDTGVAYATDGRVYILWQFHPLMKLRAGYEVLYLSGVGSAASNFNDTVPLAAAIQNTGQTPTRAPFLDLDDQAIFDGANVGLEIGW